MARHSTPSSYFLRIGTAILIAAVIGVAPSAASATLVTSAANIPYSGISPGGVDMSTGELILVMRPDLRLSGPIPVEFGRYYASMISMEGLASGHLGVNWLGTYDWSFSISPASGVVSVITNHGQRIQFQPGAAGGYSLLEPTDQRYQLDLVGGLWRFTHPGLRRAYEFDGSTLLLSRITDEHGNSLDLTHAGGVLIRVCDGLGACVQVSYDRAGHVSQVSDGTRLVTYEYTGDLLTRVTDAAGKPWTFSYDQSAQQQGLLTGTTEPLGNTPAVQLYDFSGRVYSQTDAAGGTATYAYDLPAGNVFTDPLGNPWTYRHDPKGSLEAIIDPASGSTAFAYDALGRPQSAMRPLGDVTTVAYDPASGYVSQVTRPGQSPFTFGYGSHVTGGATYFDLTTAGYPDGTSEIYGRDHAGNLTDFTDRATFAWHWTHNARGQVLSATNPTDGVTTFTYDPQARLVTGRDNAGNTVQFDYDGLNRLTKVAWPNGTTRHCVYDALDHVTSLTDERNKIWGASFDANGRLASATDPLMEGASWTYDDLDRVTQVVDPLNHADLFAHDAAGRLQSWTDRSERTTSYQYDALGRLSSITDPAGGTDGYTYDANGRATSANDPMYHTFIFGHDALDRVTSLTDPLNVQITFGYDGMDRLTSAAAPLGHTETFSYDPRGLLTSLVDVTSETDWPRTALGDVAQITDPNRTGWSRLYDPQGRLTSAKDPLGRTTACQYDVFSRPSQILKPNGTTDALSYDDVGRVVGWSSSGGPTFAYGYDDANRLTSATGASFAYDAAGRMTSSNGIATTYDGAGRPLSITLAPGKTVTYAYNTRGLLSGVTDWLGGTTAFAYDAARRLTGVTRPNGTSATYQYDAADRLISAVEKQPGPNDPPLASISITRDALGQPTGIDRRQPLMPGETATGSASFAYDRASQMNGVTHDPLGRTTADASRTFEWDGASRLTHYAAGADSPRFTYDAFGRVLTSTQGSQTEAFTWNYATGAPVPGTKTSLQGAELRIFVHTPEGLLLYSVEAASGDRRFYHYDEAGNTIFLTNDAGSVTASYAYSPYGDVTALGSTGGNSFTFGAGRGMMALGSSGLWLDGSKVYDSRTMRSIDGITTASGVDYDGRPENNGNRDPLESPGPPDSPIGTTPGRPAGGWYEWRFARICSPADGAAMPQTSGMAEVVGNDFVASLGAPSFDAPLADAGRLDFHQAYAGSILHEVGHSLWLCHGGPADVSADEGAGGCAQGTSPGSPVRRPNNVSMMNYNYQISLLSDWAGETPSLNYGDRGKDTYYRKRPHDAFEIKDFSFGLENPTTIGSATGGAGGGKAKFNEFTIKKTTDRASPAFFKNCVAGAHYKTIPIRVRKAGGDPNAAGKPYRAFRFGTVFVTAVDWSGPGDEGPDESILALPNVRPPCTWCLK